MEELEKETAKITHIGDGVYIGFDGFHITIRVNSHLGEPVVFLDPHAADALVAYAQKLRALQTGGA